MFVVATDVEGGYFGDSIRRHWSKLTLLIEGFDMPTRVVAEHLRCRCMENFGLVLEVEETDALTDVPDRFRVNVEG